MMRLFSIFLISLTLSICLFSSACDGSSGAAKSLAESAGSADKSVNVLPANPDSAHVDFRDLNYWTENKLFCVASLVDNLGMTWQSIWIRVELLDSAGNRLQIYGDSSMIMRTVAEAIPPRGASAIFAAIPFSEVTGGIPVKCRLSGAGAVEQAPRPILLSNDISGVRMQKPDPNDPNKVIELAYQASATVENPLQMDAYHMRVVLLLYGKDNKLYFVQMVNPEDPDTVIKLDRTGVMLGTERRKMTCPIVYKQLPQKLQEVLIGQVDVQAYEAAK